MARISSFTGASGVGKSTLLKELSKSFNVIELSGRDYLPQNGLDYVANKSDLIQYRINYGTMITMVRPLVGGFQEEMAWPVFYSRCAIDRLAYSRVLNVGNEIQDLIIREIELIVKSYIDVFYIPIEFPLPLNEKDEIRGKDEEVRKLTDLEIQNIIKEFNIPVVEVRGSVEKRLETIYKNL